MAVFEALTSNLRRAGPGGRRTVGNAGASPRPPGSSRRSRNTARGPSSDGSPARWPSAAPLSRSVGTLGWHSSSTPRAGERSVAGPCLQCCGCRTPEASTRRRAHGQRQGAGMVGVARREPGAFARARDAGHQHLGARFSPSRAPARRPTCGPAKVCSFAPLPCPLSSSCRLVDWDFDEDSPAGTESGSRRA